MRKLLVFGTFLGIMAAVQGCGTTSAHTETMEVIGPPGMEAQGLVSLDEHRVVFVGTTAESGGEPWISDGTVAGTVMIKDILPGSDSSFHNSPLKLVKFKGNIYFFADDGIAGVEVWRTDGTADGTVLVADTVPGALGFAQAFDLFALGDRLFIVANGEDGNAYFEVLTVS